MPRRAAAADPQQPAKTGSAARTILPFAPLAIAVVAGHVALPSATSPAPAAAAVVSTQQAVAKPVPLLKKGQAVDWWFVFKFNAATAPECGNGAQRACPFGGTVQAYSKFSQQFAYASSESPTLQKAGGCLGDTTTDPVGATFEEIYDSHPFYVVWNDQFKGDPIADEESPTGHSKGMLAWNADGDGAVMQVSTPSWPGSGSADHPRKIDGNTLGCVKDNDVLVSQHFFSLRLTKDDVVNVAKGLVNASVATDTTNPQIVNNGGPSEIESVVRDLGKRSASKAPMDVTLSTGVRFISKPSKLEVPPWQMVSAILGGEPLRVASWWTRPEIPSTKAGAAMACWDSSLGKPGDVEIATTGNWAGTSIGFQGMPEPDGNHAKVGVSTGAHPWAIFGDLNQQGSLVDGKCGSSQNGRGGTFYVVENANLAKSVADLLKGERAPQ